MTFSPSQPIDQRGGTLQHSVATTPRAGAGRRPWLYPVLVAILAIGAFALMDLPSRAPTAELQAGAESGPALDGRGKWSGYLR